MLSHNGFFVFSAELNSNSDEKNIKFTNEVKHDLGIQQIPHREVIGGYKYKDSNKVERENSFIVAAKHEKFVLDTMHIYKQESVLFVDAIGRASLIYNDGKVERIGKWNEVESLQDVTCFTFCPSSQATWTVA